MKKIIMLLAMLTFATKIEAKNVYSDYEFVGYNLEAKENDELHKYERVLMNRFYKLEMDDFAYLEKDDEGKYSHVDKNDFKKEVRYSKKYSGNRSEEAITFIKEPERYLIDKIQLNDIKRYSYFHPKEIEVFYKEKKLAIEVKNYQGLTDGNYDTQVTINEDSLEIVLPNRNDSHFLEVKIYYTSGADIKFNYTMLNTFDNQTLIYNNVSLLGNNTEVTLKLALEEEYDKMTNELSITNSQIANFYRHEVTLYKYYNQKKIYHATLEDKTLNGYTYDIDESYYAYKVYERKIIGTINDEKEPPKDQEEKPILPDQEKPSDKSDHEDTSPTLPTNKEPKPNQNTKPTSQKNISKYKNPSHNSNVISTDTKKYVANNEIEKEEEKTATDTKKEDKKETNYLSKVDTDLNKSNSCNDKIDLFEMICIILLVIVIILLILNMASVKSDEE